jgi:hypothetical protein
MKKDSETDEMMPEYDFSGGVRGKHFRRYRQGHSVIVHHGDGSSTSRQFPANEGIIQLAPDVQEYFPDEVAVNQALRCLIPLLQAERKEKAKV